MKQSFNSTQLYAYVVLYLYAYVLITVLPFHTPLL